MKLFMCHVSKNMLSDILLDDAALRPRPVQHRLYTRPACKHEGSCLFSNLPDDVLGAPAILHKSSRDFLQPQSCVSNKATTTLTTNVYSNVTLGYVLCTVKSHRNT